ASAQAAPAAPSAPAAPATAAPATADAAPSVALNSTQKLRWGSRGGAVQELQSALNANGAGLAVDGVFGKRTHAAVKDYQSSKGLQVDGVVGPKTRAALNGGVSTGGASAPSSSSSGSSSSSSSAIVNAARSAVGTPYSWGGSSLGGMDCSGLVNYAYKAAGISLPRTSGQIANGGRWISQSQAQPGDIVAWSGHVAIYAGNGQIIDASGSKQRVVERSIWGNPIGFVTYR
ncbi:MAG: NlpC/P60 family protein, partial [Brachybacterium sp.]|uniref:C40 family peptidase n=1 Tax=Brachybacterium sp. TaxID=1891286 RepID=UPI003242CF75